MVKKKNIVSDDVYKKNMFFRYLLIPLFLFFILSNFFLSFLVLVYSWIVYFIFIIFYKVKLYFFYDLNSNLVGRLDFYNLYSLDIVSMCVGISAYVLFIIILFSMDIEFKKLVNVLFNCFFYFFLFNLFRIVILIFIALNFGAEWFNMVHILFYEILVGLFAALILLYVLYKKKVVGIFPIYSDVKFLLLDVKRSFYKKK